MGNVITRNLEDQDIKEKPKSSAGKKARPVLTKDLTNEQIDRARKQGEEDAKKTEQPDSESE